MYVFHRAEYNSGQQSAETFVFISCEVAPPTQLPMMNHLVYMMGAILYQRVIRHTSFPYHNSEWLCVLGWTLKWRLCASVIALKLTVKDTDWHWTVRQATNLDTIHNVDSSLSCAAHSSFIQLNYWLNSIITSGYKWIFYLMWADIIVLQAHSKNTFHAHLLFAGMLCRFL